ncbi:hypothetical protein HNP93_000178 [Methanococcus maripaludis]|uniref:Pyrroline-5-carboxylate reductase catalytic N-terminal domain-containing protein n=1 Tax=Methanococcus maripaludis TaxID=39152 RepID=A0A7J9P453_METMI|nr:NADPH-dependent F420 reductase [Methanococcus maripaludis]MBA2857477.1 hypothetical protein [Methanococcus maripaludis]
MKIAILGGTGDQGFGLALRFSKNHEILIGSRKAEKAIEASENALKIISDKGYSANIKGMTNLEASKLADVVIVSLPFEYTISTIKELKEALKGKIVVSIGVPLATAIGDKPTRVIACPQGSVAELIQEMLPESKVVSGFQNICSKCLEDLDCEVACDVLIAGDDNDAKKVIVELASEIPGVRGIDSGKLEISKFIEQITPLLIQLNIKYKLKGAGIHITGLNL